MHNPYKGIYMKFFSYGGADARIVDVTYEHISISPHHVGTEGGFKTAVNK